MVKLDLKRSLKITVMSSQIFSSCNNGTAQNKSETINKAKADSTKDDNAQPLVSHIYTADPSAHVYNNRIYIYPSHDTATGTPEDDLGSHFNMMDYHTDGRIIIPLLKKKAAGGFFIRMYN